MHQNDGNGCGCVAALYGSGAIRVAGAGDPRTSIGPDLPAVTISKALAATTRGAATTTVGQQRREQLLGQAE